MAVRAFFALSFASLLLFGSESATFTITNNCENTIWPATLTADTGSQPLTTGFELGSKQTNTINITAPWTGRFWARTFCNSTCLTGDCGKGAGQCAGATGAPPVTLIEFILNYDSTRKDVYDVSNIDGFNLPVKLVPEAACNPTSCTADINAECPAELAAKGPDGSIVGCKSACAAFKTLEYCCTGEFSSPEKCIPSKYSQYFENKCPEANSNPSDGTASPFTCPTGTNYKITFCP